MLQILEMRVALSTGIVQTSKMPSAKIEIEINWTSPEVA